ncbi:MAG: hypothetical protein ABIN61_05065 [candidate division WOR-3 bacterium]
MKFYKITILFIFSLFLKAQFTLRIHQPPPNQLKIEDLWWIDITNSSNTSRNVYLRGEVRELRKGLLFRGSTNEFTIPLGKTRIKATDIKELRDKWYREEDKDFIVRTGSVPPGDYTACVYLIDASTNQELTHQCINILVQPSGPPRLISPKTGEPLKNKRPIFTWTRPTPLPPGEKVFYKIKIVEIYEGQTKEEAIRSNPSWYEEERISKTTFQYPIKGRELDPQKRYAWQVQAFYKEGFPLGENRGLSEVWEIGPIIKVKPIPLLPSYLIIGEFLIKNITYTSFSLDSLSGVGESFFLEKNLPTHFGGPIFTLTPVKFQVNFQKLKVNWEKGDTGKVISGEIIESFPNPIEVKVEGYPVFVHNVHLMPDSAIGIIGVSIPCLYDTAGCKTIEIESFKTKISPILDIYKELESGERGPYRLGETGILIKSKEKIIIDLSHKITPGKIEIQLKKGETVEQTQLDTCNTGYLYAHYIFNNAVSTPAGFNATFQLAAPWTFHSLIPMGFEVHINEGYLKIDSCKIKEGKFKNGYIVLPSDSNGVTDEMGNPIQATYDSLLVNSSLDIGGKLKIDKEMRWGGFGLKVVHNSKIKLPATSYQYYSIVEKDTFVTINPDTLIGLVISRIDQRYDLLTVYSKDSKAPIRFERLGAPENKTGGGWFNLEMQGMRGYLSSDSRTPPLNVKLGIPGKTGYLSDSSFNTTFTHNEIDSTFMKFWFLGNSSFNTDLRGKFQIPYPSNIKPPFRELGITSTGSFAGGNAFFPSLALTLDYWGVGISSKRGVISVKKGEIVYTNAEIYEPVHFSKGFNIIWGEMLSDGDLGEFYFNHNAAHQKFDGFPITLDSAALSEFDPSRSGELVVKCGIHFNFFGEPDTLITIHDAKYSATTSPYFGRIVSIEPSKFSIYRNWGSGLAKMDFKEVGYDAIDQNGFIGLGKVDFNFFTSSPINAEIELDSIYIKICILETKQHNLRLSYVELTSLGEIWGCAVIEGDELNTIALGGRLETSTGGGFELLSPKAGTGVEVKMAITPNIINFDANGIMYLYVFGVDLEINGSLFLKTDLSRGSVEGEIKGAFDLSALGLDIEADGQANWCFAPLSNYIQGRLAVNICEVGFGSGLSGGLFIGINAPKDKLWVLREGSSLNRKFGINLNYIPNNVTGVYVFGDTEFSISLAGVIEGGIEMYAGVGAFLNLTPTEDGSIIYSTLLPLPYAVGIVGVYIYGEILWGVLSASAWGKLAMYLGDPMGFEGTFGLRACALWVFCGEVEVTAGMNSKDGFYLE